MRAQRLASLSIVTAALLSPIAARASEPIRTLDLRALFGVASTDVAVRRDAYDVLVAAACVQGIVNRTSPRLHLFYVKSVVDGSIDTDELWFDRLADPAIGAGTVAGRTIEALASIEQRYMPILGPSKGSPSGTRRSLRR